MRLFPLAALRRDREHLGYTMYHNSHLNKRGTAILIANKLNFTIVDSYKDEECNIILLKIRMCGINITFGSIYGPNVDNEQFFNTLQDKISYLNSDFIIIGGDWNTTLDQRNCAAIIDTYNTVGIPSARRSAWLNQLCTGLSLKDPYRYFYPETREFTYVSYSVNATNRSPLDYFLISEDLLTQCINCRIPNTLSSLLFDHKQVSLIFRRDNPYKKQTLNDSILKDVDIVEIVNLTTVECYINHLSPTATLSDIEINNFKEIIGHTLNHYKELVGCRLKIAENGLVEENTAQALILRNAIKNNLDILPDIDDLQAMEIDCSRGVFFGDTDNGC
jgi:exonuclease III